MAEAIKEAKKTTYFATLRDIPSSPRKMRYVVDLVRGMEVNKAFATLKFVTKHAAKDVEKVLKSAVGRNRIRRRAYEAIRAELPNIQKPVDCIFIIYSKDLLDIDFKELRHLIHNLLLEAGII